MNADCFEEIYEAEFLISVIHIYLYGLPAGVCVRVCMQVFQRAFQLKLL